MSFILDVLIEFLIRMAINTFRKARSRSWPVITATVTGSRMDKGHSGGSQIAVVVYGYVAANERFSASYKEPFLFDGFGEDYIRRFPVGCDYPVRLNPSDPSNSFPVRA